MDGSFAFFLLICALFGVAGGLQGRAKGSSFLLWFFIAACLPLFGFLASVVYPGRQYELRRRCDGCGRLLPITDTMCMGCGTDLDFPEVRYRSVAGSVIAVGPDGLPIEDPSTPGDGGEDDSPYERADNPYELVADGDDASGPAAPPAGVATPDR
ncbi:unannotated protein [freshwater metagenome]|uniref:Unannotated protein n=1 Tax=freshwater metagenome TaxID=449393 RepID=A0A6J7FVK6_9ZZZZ